MLTVRAPVVPVYTAALIGLLTSTGVFYTNKYKYLISIDEGLDIFAIHGVGGFLGDILTGFFAASWVPALDGVSGTTYAGGWWDRNWIQMGYQLAAATTCAAWSFVVSCILLFVIDRIPGCRLRVEEDDELRGLDFKYLSDVHWDGAEKGHGHGAVDGLGEVGLGDVGVHEGVPFSGSGPGSESGSGRSVSGNGGVKAERGDTVKRE